MKKAFAFLLAAVMLVMCMSGCGNKNVKPAESSSALPSTSNDDAVEEELFRCDDGENEYYCVESDSDYELFRKSKATGEAVSIRKERYISCLTLADGWLYYASNAHDLCRISVTGDGYEKLLDYGEWLLYTNGPGRYDGDDIRIIYVLDSIVFTWQQSFRLFRIDPQTQETFEVTCDARTIRASGDHVYYCGKDFDICMIGPHDEGPTAILESEKIGDNSRDWQSIYKNFIFIGDTMYYYKRLPDGLYSYRNGESVLIDDYENTDEFSMDEYNGKLYYMARSESYYEQDGDKSSRLMCYNPESGVLSKVADCDSYSSGGYVSDGKYYYRDYDENQCEIMIEE